MEIATGKALELLKDLCSDVPRHGTTISDYIKVRQRVKEMQEKCLEPIAERPWSYSEDAREGLRVDMPMDMTTVVTKDHNTYSPLRGSDCIRRIALTNTGL